ncbi:MAG: IS1 family transposase, partial [Capnocytophaga sp.]|nr:IS1 family transposase [Capnocytophaga sp.]
IEQVSIKKVLSVLVSFNRQIKPKELFYNLLQVDKLWTFVGEKKNKRQLIYVYSSEKKEVVGGNGEIETRKRLETS